MVPTCLSFITIPQLVRMLFEIQTPPVYNLCNAFHQKALFAKNATGLRITDVEEMKMMNEKSKRFVIHCMPLMAIIWSLDMTTIDFFSLDAKGSEFEILRTIAFERILIKVFVPPLEQSCK